MKSIFSATVLAIALAAAAPALAQPNPQLVLQVQQGIERYDIEADVSQYDTHTVASLWSILNGGKPYLTTRRELQTELRKANAATGGAAGGGN